MKILHLTCTHPPYKGGIGNVAYSFATSLCDRDYNISVLTPRYKRVLSSVSNENKCPQIIRVKPLIQYGNSAFLPFLNKYFKDCDIIHLHWPFFGIIEVLYLFLKQNPQKRFCMTYHMDFVAPNFFTKLMSFFSMKLLPKLVSRAEFITVSSLDYLKHSQIKELYKKMPNKFIEIPFGVDKAFGVKEVPFSFYNQHQIDVNKKIILFVGALDKAHYFKGISVLLNAYSRLDADIIAKSQLVIVGKGDCLMLYQKKAQNLKIASSVVFTGSLSLTDLVLMYNASDIVVLPSINSGEAFGIVLVEAMACATPVIASSLAGVRSVVRDNYNGFLVPPRDNMALSKKIKELLLDDTLRFKFSKNALKSYQEKYQWDKIIDRLSSKYKKS